MEVISARAVISHGAQHYKTRILTHLPVLFGNLQASGADGEHSSRLYFLHSRSGLELSPS